MRGTADHKNIVDCTRTADHKFIVNRMGTDPYTTYRYCHTPMQACTYPYVVGRIMLPPRPHIGIVIHAPREIRSRKDD